MGTTITTPFQNTSPLRKFARDTTTAVVTANGDTTLATLSVSAGTCSQYIMLIVEGTAISSEPAAATTEYIALKVDVDASNKVTTLWNKFETNLAGSAFISSMGSTYVWYYEPTAGEKSAGFTVTVIASLVTAGGASLDYRQATILGY